MIEPNKEEKEELKEKATCLNCGRQMIPIFDDIAGKVTYYQWKCVCLPKDVVVSIG